MYKLILVIFLCTIITKGYLQEIKGSSPQNIGNDNVASQIWSLRNQRRSKPCPKRRNNGEVEQWIPSYSSRTTQPRYDNLVLQPQALKINEVLETTDPRNEDKNQKILDRHFFDLNTKEAEEINDDDCIDYIESVNESSISSTAEEAAIKLIKDCLKRKQKNNISILPAIGSRRSMSDTDNEDILDTENNNNYPRASDIDDSDISENFNSNISNRRSNENVEGHDEEHNQLTSKLMDPKQKNGILVGESNSIFLKDPRVCYACSTATNPSCWEPNRRTTVKYCPKEQSCVTKSFGEKSALTVIRDCANNCEDTSLFGIEPKFKSCKLCHSDYCNGAITINTYNLVTILVISIAKYIC